jgi:lipopolysaccharide/colanic/teichoic acid biosynthesis glycosyltransferase
VVIRAHVGIYPAFKRATDIILASFLLILAVPLVVVIAVAIKLESAGPIVFSQERVGLGGRLFTIHKFRSMSAVSPRYSYKVPLGDPRITKVGRILRRSGFDELPQLWNVVRGDMSLIGPRPELPFIVGQYQPLQHIRHSMRPGVTGWWQIHQRNIPNTMEEDSADPAHLERFAYDLYYLDHVSFKLDLNIAIRTARLMFMCLLRPNSEPAAPTSTVSDVDVGVSPLPTEGSGAKAEPLAESLLLRQNQA